MLPLSRYLQHTSTSFSQLKTLHLTHYHISFSFNSVRINFRSLAYITFVIKSSTRSHTRHPLTFPSQHRKYLSFASSPGVCWCNIPVYTGLGRHDRTGTGVEESCLKTLDTAPLRLCVTRLATATSFPSPGSASRCRTLQRMYIDDEIVGLISHLDTIVTLIFRP